MRDKIPKNFFLYWSGQDFQFVHYLCVLSLLENNKVEKCEVYYEEEPVNNYYWDHLKALNGIRLEKLDYSHLFKIAKMNKDDFDLFFTKARVNHKSSFFRYLALYCFGGVYLDFDTLVIKDLSPLLDTKFFVGVQGAGGNMLNNAIIGAVENSPVLRGFLDEIIKISKEKKELRWPDVGPNLITKNLFSRQKHFLSSIIIRILFNFSFNNKKIIRFFGLCMTKMQGVTIYPRSFFYYYSWPEWQKIFQKSFISKEAYLIHLWGKFSCDFTRKINESYIKNDDSLYSNIAKKILFNGHFDN